MQININYNNSNSDQEKSTQAKSIFQQFQSSEMNSKLLQNNNNKDNNINDSSEIEILPQESGIRLFNSNTNRDKHESFSQQYTHKHPKSISDIDQQSANSLRNINNNNNITKNINFLLDSEQLNKDSTVLSKDKTSQYESIQNSKNQKQPSINKKLQSQPSNLSYTSRRTRKTQQRLDYQLMSKKFSENQLDKEQEKIIKEKASAHYQKAKQLGKVQRIQQYVKNIAKQLSTRRFQTIQEHQINLLNDKSFYMISKKKNLQFQQIYRFILLRIDTIVGHICVPKTFHPFSKFITFFQILESITILFDFFVYTLFCFYKFFIPEFFFYVCIFSVVTFLIGTFLRLNTGYLDDGIIIFDKKKIIQKYREELFFNDIIGYVGMLYQLFSNNDDELTKQLCFLLIFKYKIHLLNLERLEQKLSLSGNQIFQWSLFKLLASSLALCHVIGTAYFFLSFCERFYLEYADTWVQANDLEDKHPFQQYLHSFFWALSIVTLMDSQFITDLEAVFCLVSLILTIGVFATILSQVSIVWEEMAKKSKEYKKDKDILNSFFKMHNMTYELQGQLHNYLKYSYEGHVEKTSNNDFEGLMSKFPIALQEKVKLERYSEKVNLFNIVRKHFSPKVVEQLVNNVKQEYYMPNQVIFQKDIYKEPCLYVLLGGEAELFVNSQQGKSVLFSVKIGDCFGESTFFSDQCPLYSARSKQKTYTTLLVITRTKFLQILKQCGTEEDRQKFCEIKDELILKSYSNTLKKKCYICHDIYHNEQKCNLITYKPNKNLIARLNKWIFQKRNPKQKRYNSEKHLSYRGTCNILQDRIDYLLQNAELRKYIKVIQEHQKELELQLKIEDEKEQNEEHLEDHFQDYNDNNQNLNNMNQSINKFRRKSVSHSTFNQFQMQSPLKNPANNHKNQEQSIDSIKQQYQNNLKKMVRQASNLNLNTPAPSQQKTNFTFIEENPNSQISSNCSNIDEEEDGHFNQEESQQAVLNFNKKKDLYTKMAKVHETREFKHNSQLQQDDSQSITEPVPKQNSAYIINLEQCPTSFNDLSQFPVQEKKNSLYSIMLNGPDLRSPKSSYKSSSNIGTGQNSPAFRYSQQNIPHFTQYQAPSQTSINQRQSIGSNYVFSTTRRPTKNLGTNNIYSSGTQNPQNFNMENERTSIDITSHNINNSNQGNSKNSFAMKKFMFDLQLQNMEFQKYLCDFMMAQNNQNNGGAQGSQLDNEPNLESYFFLPYFDKMQECQWYFTHNNYTKVIKEHRKYLLHNNQKFKKITERKRQALFNKVVNTNAFLRNTKMGLYSQSDNIRPSMESFKDTSPMQKQQSNGIISIINQSIGMELKKKNDSFASDLQQIK